MVSQARSQCKTMLVNKALVLSVRRHHARVTHQIMLLVLSSAGALGAKGSNELLVSLFHSQDLNMNSPFSLSYIINLLCQLWEFGDISRQKPGPVVQKPINADPR